MKFLLLNKTAETMFNKNYTLLEQLIATEQALNEATTVTVRVETDGNKATIILGDASGTEISSNTIDLPVGPQGPQGVEGPQGANGEPGRDGLEGAGVFPITGEPDETITAVSVSSVTLPPARNGRIYPGDLLLAGNGNVYRTISGNTVVSPTVPVRFFTNIKGTAGQNGVSVNGVEVVNEEVVNDETLSTVRVYLDNNTYEDFVLAVKNGATGPQGPQGPQGLQGPQGPQGQINGSLFYVTNIRPLSGIDVSLIFLVPINKTLEELTTEFNENESTFVKKYPCVNHGWFLLDNGEIRSEEIISLWGSDLSRFYYQTNSNATGLTVKKEGNLTYNTETGKIGFDETGSTQTAFKNYYTHYYLQKIQNN